MGAELRTYRIGRLTERPINNAQLIGATIYRTRLDLFDRWHLQHGGDVQPERERHEGAAGGGGRRQRVHQAGTGGGVQRVPSYE